MTNVKCFTEIDKLAESGESIYPFFCEKEVDMLNAIRNALFF